MDSVSSTLDVLIAITALVSLGCGVLHKAISWRKRARQA